MPLTVSDLRDYFERREAECQMALNRANKMARALNARTSDSDHQARVNRSIATRANLYRELVGIIDRDELPD